MQLISVFVQNNGQRQTSSQLYCERLVVSAFAECAMHFCYGRTAIFS
jgi:hypothetical protein